MPSMPPIPGLIGGRHQLTIRGSYLAHYPTARRRRRIKSPKHRNRKEGRRIDDLVYLPTGRTSHISLLQPSEDTVCVKAMPAGELSDIITQLHVLAADGAILPTGTDVPE